MQLAKNISIFILFVFTFLFSCSDDICEVSPINDSIRYLSITGTVINLYDNQPVEGVRLSMLDQIAGSGIIKWDTTQYSGKKGCFKFEEERDMALIDEILRNDPSIRIDQINQSVSTIDDRYLCIRSRQGANEFSKRGRFQYDSDIPMEIFVVPSANLSFEIINPPQSTLYFRWSFVNLSLVDFPNASFDTNYFLNPQAKIRIPAEREILVEIYDDNQLEIYTTNILASHKEEIVVSF